MKETTKKDTDLLAARQFFSRSTIFLFIIYLPVLFVNDDYISAHSYLVEFSNLFSDIFSNIEDYAILSSHYELYNKAKLSHTLGVFTTAITCVWFFYILFKTYLHSLGFFKDKNDNFMSKGVQEAEFTLKEIFYYTLFSMFLLIAYSTFYFGTTNTEYQNTAFQYLTHGNSFALVFYAIAGWFVSIMTNITIYCIFLYVYRKYKNISLKK